jgi:hypothetical protein
MTLRIFAVTSALAVLASSQPASAHAWVRTQQPQASPTSKAVVEHAIAGEIEKIDHASRTIQIRTADGVEATVKFTDRTTVHGLKDVSRALELEAKAGLEGGSAVIHYTGQGADRTAVEIDHLGKRTLKTAKGTVVRVDEAGTFVVVKTKTGTDETFEFTKDAVVDSDRGVETAEAGTGKSIKKGTEVTVHYSESAGKKLLHLLEHVQFGPLPGPGVPR